MTIRKGENVDSNLVIKKAIYQFTIQSVYITIIENIQKSLGKGLG